MVYEAFSPSDVTVVLKTPSDTDVHTEWRHCTAQAPRGSLWVSKRPALSPLSSLPDNLTAFFLQLYS